MKVLKWLSLIFLGVILWFWWGLWGHNILRDIQCGPSKSITKPMAVAIVREINKRGTPEKVVKLDSLKNLPYALVECEKEVLEVESLPPKGVQFESKQTCYFNDNRKGKYLVRVETKGMHYSGTEITIEDNGNMYIYIRKNNLNQNDLTEIEYRAVQYMDIGEKRVDINKWRFLDTSRKNYSKQSKDRCRYKSPLRF